MREGKYFSMTDTIKSKRKILVGDSYVDVPNVNVPTDKDSVIQNLRETINSQAQIIAELSRVKYELEKHSKEIQNSLDDLKQLIKDSRE